jgi:hypothetical protein
MGDTRLLKPEVKAAFDDQIIKEYLTEFKQSRRDADGKPMVEDAIWMDMAKTLGLSDDTLHRHMMGWKKDRNPISPFDGQEDRNPPPLETVFRYIAAIDDSVEFPRGREIVNRALATALRRIRYSRTGENLPLTSAEVERLRFLRQWKVDDIPRPAISTITVKDMRRCYKFRSLMEPIRRDKEFVEGLKLLQRRWSVLFLVFVQLTNYAWVT